MERIKDTLDIVFKDLVAKKSGASDEGPEGWLRKILTKKELGHIKLQYFRKGIIGCNVDSSVWLYSFNLKKETMLQKLKGFAKDIQEIRFSIGDLK